MGAKAAGEVRLAVKKEVNVYLFRKAALDDGNKKLILRGVVDPKCLDMLLVDDYQRESLPYSTQEALIKAFREGVTVPDLDLGFRGGTSYERRKNGDFVLKGQIYIIDGLQRTQAALRLMQNGEHPNPHLGAVVHFDTSNSWEKDRFQKLNLNRTKLSPNIIARNLSTEIPAIDVLYQLSQDSDFVLGKRICWNQIMVRQELITSVSYLKVAGNLMGHLGPGRGSRVVEISNGLQTIMESATEEAFRDNVREYFALINNCWGIRNVTYSNLAAYLRTSFMITLARVLSDHIDFWKGNRLFIEADLARKIGSFPLSDPNIIHLACIGGKNHQVLRRLIIDHINSGKRTRHLKARSQQRRIVSDEHGE